MDGASTFYSKDIRKMKQNNLSPFQKRYYAKMYRLRIVEQNRFKINVIKYADDLKRFHQLQDEYLMLVDNNIRDFFDLLNYKNEQENKIREIDDRQHEIYRINSSKKRAIKTDEQYRDYQLWHMGIQKELGVLKQQKKDVKKQLGLVDMAIKENLYTACGDVPDMETKLIEDNEMVIPQMETEQVREVNTDKIVSMETEESDVGIGRGATEPDNEITFKGEGCLKHDIENIDQAEVEADVETYDELICNYDYEGKLYANYGDSRDVYCDSSKFREGKEDVLAETTKDEKSIYSYADYVNCTDEEKLQVMGVSMNDDVMQVYAKLCSLFKQIGYNTDFDEIYEEAKRLVGVVGKIIVADKAEKVASELLACGPYRYLKTSVKADVFKFDVGDASSNLKLLLSVLDKLVVKMDGDELYKEYQKIYDETVNRNDVYEKEQEKQWNRGRGR